MKRGHFKLTGQLCQILLRNPSGGNYLQIRNVLKLPDSLQSRQSSLLLPPTTPAIPAMIPPQPNPLS